MDIHDKRPEQPTSIVPGAAAGPEDGHRAREGADSAKDRVKNFDQGVSRAEETDHDRDVPRGTLPPERIIELRRGLQAGRHNDPKIIASVARRMIERGDI